jgi:hypothetical protein
VIGRAAPNANGAGVLFELFAPNENDPADVEGAEEEPKVNPVGLLLSLGAPKIDDLGGSDEGGVNENGLLRPLLASPNASLDVSAVLDCDPNNVLAVAVDELVLFPTEDWLNEKSEESTGLALSLEALKRDELAGLEPTSDEPKRDGPVSLAFSLDAPKRDEFAGLALSLDAPKGLVDKVGVDVDGPSVNGPVFGALSTLALALDAVAVERPDRKDDDKPGPAFELSLSVGKNG